MFLGDNEMLERFNDLYYTIEGSVQLHNGEIEQHPQWRELEYEYGQKVTMQEVANWGYIYLK